MYSFPPVKIFGTKSYLEFHLKLQNYQKFYFNNIVADLKCIIYIKVF